jgi:dipeptidyl aminopeptidase/acylaminoacyl peptidase
MQFTRIAPILLLATLPLAAQSTPNVNAAPTGNPPASAGGKVTKANYELASRWTAAKTGKVIFDVAVTPHWLEDGDRFWYTFESATGRRFVLVDPAKKTKTLVFDPVKMASALTVATGLPWDSQHLPMRTLKFVKQDASIQFDITVPKDAVIPGEKKPAANADAKSTTNTPDEIDDGDPQQRGGGRGGAAAGGANSTTKSLTFEYDLAANKLTLLDEKPPAKPRWASVSPDDKTIVFARNHNLWMMDAENFEKAKKKATDPTIKETQITTDGMEDFSYAARAGGAMEQQQEGEQQQEQTNVDDKNARVRPITINWAQDSKKFAVVRQDQRKVAKLWVINSLANPRPKLETQPYAMPGEADQPIEHMEMFDVASKSRVEVKAALWQDQALGIASAPAEGRAREKEKTEPRWAASGSDKLYFSRISRDLHRLDLCVADTATGEVKPVIEERMNVYIDITPSAGGGTGFTLRLLNNGSEILWWSERDGWGHYYLYSADGKLKNQVTKGEFVAEGVTGVDEKTRTLYLMANGREEGEDPYYMHEYAARLDGSGMRLLSPGNTNHAALMSDSGRFFIDNYSRVDSVPDSVLFDVSGAKILQLEKPDLTRAIEAGFKFPEPFKVKADDGMTDLYGVMYKPFDFDPAKKYPIIAYVYPGPQTESVTKSFSPKNANVSLANLGFIVIEVGNRGGNPQRSKWYHTYGYTNLRDFGLADKKAAIEQLASRFTFIDIDRVGITGHSGGGFMSTAAMLIYPDFFKVAVSESGNHENNIYNRWWSEKHDGVREVTDKDGKVHFEYDIDRNSDIAKNLKGHLMLSTGDIDDNVSPSNTIRLMDALMKANKRFDFVLIPGVRHAYAARAEYFQWIRADYFCKYLLGDFDQSVDMWELNREKPQDNKTPGAPKQVISTLSATTTNKTADK